MTTGPVAQAAARKATRDAGGLKIKTYCKGYAVDRAAVLRAYDAWLSSESGHKNGWRVGKEYGGAEALTEEILWEVTMRSLRFKPIVRYNRVEPTNGKVREIGIASVKQQVVDYIVVTAVSDLLSAKLGYYQVAAVKGKGQGVCARALSKWVREGGYFVKADVRKCYPSIKHDVVMRILRRYVRSPDVLYCAEALLATYGHGGLEIGSYFSLCMAQLVLSCAYHHVEGLHKTRRDRRVSLVSHQIWHLDDVMLFSRGKRDLRMAMRSLEHYMASELGLELKPWKICKVSPDEPCDMGGFVVRHLRSRTGKMRVRVTVRHGTFLRTRRAFRAFARRPGLAASYRVISYWGKLVHSDSYGFVSRTGARLAFNRARRIVAAHDRMEAKYGMS